MDPSLGTEVPTKLWRAFAGKTAKVPPLNSLVYYFPQGHAAHASSPPNFSSNTPHSVPCWVSDVQFLGSQHTDEVFAVLKLIPVPFSISENPTPTDFFARAVETDSHAKVLTPSDANNGGGFSVPNACAESVFPRLDKSVEKPAQDLSMRDVHGETWKFRHIYRGSPKRHLLTTGWSAFVNAKMLASEDTVVFARGDDGVVCVALRRRMTAEGQNRLFWLPPEDVVRAAELVASGDQFEVVYYPNRGPAFCVEIHTVDRALNFPWVRGVKIRMTVEGVKGFVNGSVLSALAADRVRWPDSPWELLEVAWDRSNTGRVNPWSVEVVSPSPYNEQDKPSTSAEKENEQDKPSTLAEKEKFVLLFGSRISTCSEHEMRCHNDKRQFKSNSFITSIQEARHEPISKAASSNSQNNQTHNNCYGNYQSQSDGFPQENHDTELSSNGSNALALESSHFRGLKRSRSMAQPQETLNDEPEKEGHVRFCEVFVNDTIGRWINLSLFHSYEHLLENLAHMFSMTDSQLRSGLFYDGPGGIRRSVGKEPYKDFMKTSKIYIYPNMSL